MTRRCRSAAHARNEDQVELFGAKPVPLPATLAPAPLAKAAPDLAEDPPPPRERPAAPLAVELRSAVATDVGALRALQERCLPRELRANQTRGACLVAEVHERIVGVAFAHVLRTRTEGNTWHVHAIGVDPTVQRHGVGRKLLEALIEKARRPVVTAKAHSEAGRALLVAFGFVVRSGLFTWDERARPYRPPWAYPAALAFDPREAS